MASVGWLTTRFESHLMKAAVLAAASGMASPAMAHFTDEPEPAEFSECTCECDDDVAPNVATVEWEVFAGSYTPCGSVMAKVERNVETSVETCWPECEASSVTPILEMERRCGEGCIPPQAEFCDLESTVDTTSTVTLRKQAAPSQLLEWHVYVTNSEQYIVTSDGHLGVKGEFAYTWYFDVGTADCFGASAEYEDVDEVDGGIKYSISIAVDGGGCGDSLVNGQECEAEDPEPKPDRTPEPPDPPEDPGDGGIDVWSGDADEGDGDCESDESSSPVDLLLGHKIERSVDLFVRLPGRDFSLVREYSSDPSLYSPNSSGEYFWNGAWDEDVEPGHIGTRWSSPLFASIVGDTADGESDLILVGESLQSRDRFAKLDTQDIWVSSGGGSRYIEKDTRDSVQGLSSISASFDVWRVRTPGQGERVYIAADTAYPTATGPVDIVDLVGLPIEELDQYGNIWKYEWISLGTNSVGGRQNARLGTLHLQDSANNTLARVKFYWNGQGGYNSVSLNSAGKNYFGRLAEVHVERYNGSSWVVTNKVRYLYLEDLALAEDDFSAPGHEMTYSLSITYDASQGDLCEVIQSELVDNDFVTSPPSVPDYFERVTQYRYYAGNNAFGSWVDDGDTVLNAADWSFQGEEHQLMAVLYPAQIEFYADVVHRAANRIREDSEAIDDLIQWETNSAEAEVIFEGLYPTSGRFVSAVQAAERLRWITLYDDPTYLHEQSTAILFPNSEWSSFLELTGKLISYYTDSSAEHGEAGRVRSQLVSTGSAGCGCGGGGEAFALGRRIDYIYTRYKIDGTPTVPAPVLQGFYAKTDGYSCLLVESFVDSETPLAYEPYRVYAHDYYWPTNFSEGEVSEPWPARTSSRGIYRRAFAILEADPAWDFDPYSTTTDIVKAGTLVWASIPTYELTEDPSSAQFTNYFAQTKLMLPSAVTASSGYAAVSGHGSGVTPPAIPTSSTGGRVLHYEYSDGFASGLKDSIGTSGTQQTIATYQRTAARPDLQTQVSYPTGASTSQQQNSEFGYHNSTGSTDPNGAIIAWVRSTVIGETEDQNGPSTATDYSNWSMYDLRGQLRWTRNEVGTLTYYEYDPATGANTLVVQDADPSGAYIEGDAELATDFAGVTGDGDWWLPTRSDYAELTQAFEYDLLGRLTTITAPSGVTSYTRRELAWTDTVGPTGELEPRGVAMQATISLPFHLSAGSFDGPISIDWLDADDRDVRTSRFIAEPMGGSYAPLSGTYVLGDEVTRSERDRAVSGAVVRSRDWHTLGLVTSDEVVPYSNDGSYLTRTAYDQHGRVWRTIDPEGGVTEMQYDLLGRVTTVALGTVDSTPQVVATNYYDHTMSMSSQPVSGVGEGRRTRTAMSDGTSTRATDYWFDYRGRLIGQKNPVAPHQVYKHDYRGRVISEASFTTGSPFVWGPSASLPDADTASSTRSTYSQTLYNNRGLVYRTLTALDATGVTTSGNLESNTWYDAAGRTVASWAPGGPSYKTVYDALDRVQVAYVTDRHVDAAPGAEDNHDHATDVSDDHVIAQSEFEYVGNGKPGAGEAELVTQRHRLHTLLETTDYDGPLSGDMSVSLFTLSEFDDASRVIRTHQYGTNGDGFIADTSAPSRPSVTDDVPDDDALVTEVGFDEWGRPVRQTSPGGKIILSVLDALSRTTAVIEAQDLVEPEHIALDGDDWEVGWDEAYGMNPLPTAADRVTTFRYNGLGQIVRRTAHIPGGDVQSTLYVYGTATGGSGPTASLVARSDLLLSVHYPDETTGLPDPEDDEYAVRYGYNRLGELTGMIDQNGSSHIFSRDSGGRVVSDSASVASANPYSVDTLVDEIETEYDHHGRLLAVRSLNGSTVVNAVEYGYTPLHQVSTITQNQGDDVGTTGDQIVVYQYANAVRSGSTGNYSRLSGLRYPSQSSGSTLEYDYGDTDSVADRIGRISGLDVGGWTYGTDDLVDYSYLGQSMPVKVVYGGTAADLGLDYTKAPDGVNGASTGDYPGLDTFGRVVWHGWVTSGFTTGPNANLPDRAPLLGRIYEYDTDSNRVRDYDGRPGAVPADRDWRYVYDALDRLGTAYRGRHTPGSGADNFVVSTGSLEWGLDILGNWDKVSTDADGVSPVVWSNNAAERENRAHNMANELLSRSNPGPGGSSSIIVEPSYDANGNFATNWPNPSSSISLTYTHDLWNRLVRVTKTSNSAVVLENEYNGLGWRTKRRMDLSQGVYNGVDEERTYYYSANWQVLEEHVDTDLDDDADFKGQQFWGPRYIDDAVAKRIDRDADDDWEQDPVDNYYYLTDVMFSVRAVADSSGDLHSWIDYSPYGVAQHRYAADLDASGTIDFSDVSIFLTNGNSGTPIFPGDTGYDPDADLSGDRIGAATSNQFFNEYAVFSGRYNAYSTGGSNPTVPAGGIDSVDDTAGSDNGVGYDGYWFDLAGATEATSSGLYIVRHRVYDPRLGRWLTRDPLGYVDGSSMLEAVRSSPSTGLDPTGTKRLAAVIHGQNFFNLDLGSARTHMKSIFEDIRSNKDNEAKIFGPDADFWGTAGRWIRDRYREECKKTCGRKPSITIIGHSNGGDAARKIANELTRQGYNVAYVATIDPVGKPFHNSGKIYHLDREVNFAENWHQRSSDFQVAGFKLWGYEIDNAHNYLVQYNTAGLSQYEHAVGPHVAIVEEARPDIVSRVNNFVPLDEGECESD